MLSNVDIGIEILLGVWTATHCGIVKRVVVISKSLLTTILSTKIVCCLILLNLLATLNEFERVLIAQFVPQFHFHFMSQDLVFRRVYVRVNLVSLCNHLFRLDVLSWDEVWHASLTMGHIDLESRISGTSVKH